MGEEIFEILEPGLGATLQDRGRAGKESGIGRVGGHRAIEQMTDLRTIIVDVQEH